MTVTDQMRLTAAWQFLLANVAKPMQSVVVLSSKHLLRLRMAGCEVIKFGPHALLGSWDLLAGFE